MVIGELEPEFPLDPAKLRVRQTRRDIAHGPLPQPPHRLRAKAAAIRTELILSCHGAHFT